MWLSYSGLGLGSGISANAERLVERGLADLQAGSRLSHGQPFDDHCAGSLQFLRTDDGFASTLATRLAAAANPARVRSRMRSRSNCPSAPNRWKTRRPPGVVVSIASVRERNPTPRFSNVITVSIKCGNERPRRSNFQTISTPPSRTYPSAARNPPRSARAPEVRSSNTLA